MYNSCCLLVRAFKQTSVCLGRSHNHNNFVVVMRVPCEHACYACGVRNNFVMCTHVFWSIIHMKVRVCHIMRYILNSKEGAGKRANEKKGMTRAEYVPFYLCALLRSGLLAHPMTVPVPTSCCPMYCRHHHRPFRRRRLRHHHHLHHRLFRLTADCRRDSDAASQACEPSSST